MVVWVTGDTITAARLNDTHINTMRLTDVDPTPIGDLKLKVIDENLRIRNAGDTVDKLLALTSVPNLPASKITSERFPTARIPDGTIGRVLTAQGAGADPIYDLRFQVKTVSVVADNNTYYNTTITWDNAFATILAAIPVLRKDSEEDVGAYIGWMVKSISTTGCVIRWRSNNAGTYYLDVLGIGT